jgi:hypothetical protein
MNLLKKAAFSLFFCLITFSVFSQVDRDTVAKAPAASKSDRRYFNALYMGILADVIVSPYTPLPNYYNNFGYPPAYTQQGNIPYRTTTINLMSLGYRGWYNVVEFNDNTSFSLGASPIVCFGLSVAKEGAAGLLCFYMPVMAEFHFGNGATYKTDKEIGFTCGGGIEIIKAPLVVPPDQAPKYTDNNGNVVDATVTTAWVQPCIDAGVTFWTKSNMAFEIIAKYGFGASTSFIGEDGTTPVTGRPSSYSLGIIYYLGY